MLVDSPVRQFFDSQECEVRSRMDDATEQISGRFGAGLRPETEALAQQRCKTLLRRADDDIMISRGCLRKPVGFSNAETAHSNAGLELQRLLGNVRRT